MKKSVIFLFIILFIFQINAKQIFAQPDYDNYLKSIEFAKQNDFSNALIHINKSLEKFSQNSEYLAYKAFILRNLQKYSDALFFIEKAIKLNNKVGWFYVEAVVNAFTLKKSTLAKQYAENAISFGETALGSSNYNYIVDIINQLKTIEYVLNFHFNPNNKKLVYETDGSLCIPIPSSDLPYQTATFKLKNAVLIKSLKENSCEFIYIKPSGTSEVSITCTIIKNIYSYNTEIAKAVQIKNYDNETKKYLESSDLYNLNSEHIRSIAKTLKASTDFETINNIINWVNSTKIYCATPPVWRTADDLIQSKTVECATGSLAVIVLARACGIPARQVWGPIDAGKDFAPENYFKGHVWFEFYLQNAGWIPAEQFDKNSVGFLPISYIRILTSKTHLFNNTPLGNIMTIMHNDKFGDIVKYEKTIKN